MNEQVIKDHIARLIKSAGSMVEFNFIYEGCSSKDEPTRCIRKNGRVLIEISERDMQGLPEALAMADKHLTDIEKELRHDSNSPNLFNALYAHYKLNKR